MEQGDWEHSQNIDPTGVELPLMEQNIIPGSQVARGIKPMKREIKKTTVCKTNKV